MAATADTRAGLRRASCVQPEVRRTLRDEGEAPSQRDEDPVIPALDPATGLLPVGRHACSESELERRFVSAPDFASSITRRDIWQHWEQARQLLQAAVTVHAAWLGGSFTTSKIDPDDIDVTFLINADDYRSRPPPDQQVVNLFNTGNHVKAVLGLNVDSYVIPWEPIPQVQPFGWNLIQDQYYWARGYWDDWWQRHQVSGKGSPPVPADATPRRGYLEVLLSDYP